MNLGIKCWLTLLGRKMINFLKNLAIMGGLLRWKRMQQFGRPAFVDFNNPDFIKYAESFGANGCRIESTDAPRVNQLVRFRSGTIKKTGFSSGLFDTRYTENKFKLFRRH